MKTSETIGKVSASLCVVSTKLKGVFKNASTGRFGGYANLESIITGVTPFLNEADLCCLQGGRASMVPGEMIVTTRILHTSGEWIETEVIMPPSSDAIKKNACHAYASAYTYGRRVGLMAALNLYPTDKESDIARDDDGFTSDNVDPQGVTTNKTKNGIKQPEEKNEIDALIEKVLKKKPMGELIERQMKKANKTSDDVAALRKTHKSERAVLKALIKMTPKGAK
jgi:hypothetical protein|tara:strand:+ start:2737 stop:3411 length:675 start_codon:yes stop_codon:yes gene_type:complete